MYFMVHPRYIYDVIAKYIVVITILCKSLLCKYKPKGCSEIPDSLQPLLISYCDFKSLMRKKLFP